MPRKPRFVLARYAHRPPVDQRPRVPWPNPEAGELTQEGHLEFDSIVSLHQHAKGFHWGVRVSPCVPGYFSTLVVYDRQDSARAVKVAHISSRPLKWERSINRKTGRCTTPLGIPETWKD